MGEKLLEEKHIPLIFEIVDTSCKSSAKHGINSEGVIIPGEIRQYSEHLRAAIKELLEVFQEIKNEEIVDEVTVYQITIPEEVEDLSVNLGSQTGDEGEDDDIEEEEIYDPHVNLESFSDMVNENTTIDYSKIDPDLAEQLQEGQTLELDLGENAIPEYEDRRVSQSISLSNSVRAFIKQIEEESDSKIYYRIILENFVKRYLVHQRESRKRKMDWMAEKIIMLAPSNNRLKHNPDILVRYLFREHPTDGTKSVLRSDSFGIKTYQSQDTLNAVKEILSGNMNVGE